MERLSLLGIVRRDPDPEPWSEGDNIPWHEPAFSRRMLAEHLSQAHDAASRRAPRIERHVAWIHERLLEGEPGRVLDLGCGPGLYCRRLARLGHDCVGIDYSPASIAHARDEAAGEGLGCTYHQADMRRADYGSGYDLVMLIYGELNVFCPGQARTILGKAQRALLPGGLLLLEVHTLECVRSMGCAGRTWYAAERGLFADQPYLCLEEGTWDEARQVATQRYYIIEANSGRVTRHAQSMQGYTREGYERTLREAGFGDIDWFDSMGEDAAADAAELVIIVAEKEGDR